MNTPNMDRFPWSYHRPSFNAEKEQERLDNEADRRRDDAVDDAMRWEEEQIHQDNQIDKEQQ